MNLLQWSKTKAQLESFLADKLKGRVEIHAAVYRKSHDQPSRVWMTFDKKEITSASDVTYAVHHAKLYNQKIHEQKLKPIPYHPDWNQMLNSEGHQQLVNCSEEVERMLIDQNIFESYHFYQPLMKYSSLSIDEAIHSEHIVTRAFSMLDRRLGKRRLLRMQLSSDTHPLIIQFYQLRCAVEGIIPSENYENNNHQQF